MNDQQQRNQDCFYAFQGCIDDGEYDLAYDCEMQYEESAGPMTYAVDLDGATVLKLDHEQDRYLVLIDGGREAWRKVAVWSLGR